MDNQHRLLNCVNGLNIETSYQKENRVGVCTTLLKVLESWPIQESTHNSISMSIFTWFKVTDRGCSTFRPVGRTRLKTALDGQQQPSTKSTHHINGLLFFYTYSQVQSSYKNHHGILQVGSSQSPHTSWPGGTEKKKKKASFVQCSTVVAYSFMKRRQTFIQSAVTYSSYLVMTVCRSGRMSRRIFMICGSKPISSMRSASSST